MRFLAPEFPAMQPNETWVVGAVIFDDQNRAFVQRRSMDRVLFPGRWDLVGGHVEPGETIEAALHRETLEETGWRITEVLAVSERLEWEAKGEARVEVDVIARVSGDLEHPRLEVGKHDDFRWLPFSEVNTLQENAEDDPFIYDVVNSAFAWMQTHDL